MRARVIVSAEGNSESLSKPWNSEHRLDVEPSPHTDPARDSMFANADPSRYGRVRRLEFFQCLNESRAQKCACFFAASPYGIAGCDVKRGHEGFNRFRLGNAIRLERDLRPTIPVRSRRPREAQALDRAAWACFRRLQAD